LGEALGRTVVFEPEGRATPPAIKAFYEPAREMLRRAGVDVLGFDAIRDYYRALYWRQGHAALDAATLNGERYAIMPEIRDTAAAGNFPFKRIADAFRLIDEVMEPVIVPYDGEARALIAVLSCAGLVPAGVQRKLQQYVVPLPATLRARWLAAGTLQAIQPELYGDRFVVLPEEKRGELPPLYDPAMGLRIDADPADRAAERNIFA
jgi:CRISPR-associated endonuclease/helicase Cas3